jgi:parallel beta-helix repeat protein
VAVIRVEHLRRNRSQPAGALGLVLLVACLSLGRADVAAARVAKTINVCQQGADFTTIQAAVTAAAPDDRIEVCAGSFQEQVAVNKSLTIVGAGPAQTKIVAPAPANLTGTQDIVTIGATGVDVNVDLSGFTITGPGPTGDCPGLLSGVFVRDGAHATIHGNTITALRENPLDGCQKGIGVRVGRAASATAGTATITGNTITDYQKGGIVVDNSGSDATITNNTITGVGPTDQVAQNGIQISRNATATISNNKISANSYSKGGGSTGILLYSDLGAVTVSNNTISGSDFGISLLSVAPKAEVTLRGNAVSGGDRSITLSGTIGTLIEDNKVSGAATFGLDAGATSNGNTFRSNEASGTSGDGNFDCRDASEGNRSNSTANLWIDNTGATASPDGICSAKAPPEPEPSPTPEPPPVDINPPDVIVLPPIPEDQVDEAAAGQPVPPEILNPEQPPQPGGPVAEAAADEIITEMQDEEIKSCRIQVNARGRNKLVVAQGLARAPAGGEGQMVIRLGVQPKGQQLLAKRFGGVVASVHARCLTTKNKPRAAVKTARVVLAVEHTVTAPGSWVPDLPLLTPAGQRFVDQLRKRMVAIVRIRCDGYTATWLPSPANPMALSLQRAAMICGHLKRSGGFTTKPRLVPHGRSNPIASNSTEAGRAANRRVAVTFVHRLAKRTSSARL